MKDTDHSHSSVDASAGRVFTALHRTFQLHKELIGREMAKEGSLPPEVFTLRLLALHDGLTQRDLAHRLHLSRPWMTRLLQGMERSGLVVRRADESDQRLVRVFLTDRGRRRERELCEVWATYLGRTLGTFSEGEKVEFERLLNKLNGRLSALAASGQVGEGEESL